MNNTIKKIIGGIVTVVAFALPAVSFAAVFNNDPLDFATLRVMNYTVNPTCTTCWGPTATANTGESLSFAVYYHNVGPDIATNVRVRLTPQSTVAGTVHTFTATVSADNAPAVTGTVTVTTTTSQTLSFSPGSVIWRPNQTVAGSTPLPLAQLPTDIFNGIGVNLGSVAPGWATQGSVVVRFQASAVGGTTSLPTVITSSASAISQTSATLNGFVTPNGASTNAWFEWGSTPTYGMSTAAVNYGLTATNYNNTITGLSAGTTYYFRAVAQNSQGIVYGGQMSFVAAGTTWTIPSVSTRNADVSSTLAVLNGYVDPNFTSDTVRWFEWGTTQSFGYTTTMLSHGTVASNFNATITGLVANTNYYYRAVARNSQGTVYGNTLSFTTSGQTTSTATGSTPVATTLLATELSGTTATLNGLVFTSASQASNAWFEWGTNSLLGNKTQTVGVGMLPTVKHSDAITGLVKGQTYYYRIVAENPYGKVYGSIMNFVSEGTVAPQDTTVVLTTPTKSVVTKPTVTVVTRGSSVQSLVALAIDGGIEAIAGGDKRSYHVTWKNESTQSLRNVILRVTFPQTMKFESSTSGTFSSADNTVTLDIKTLASGDAGEAFVTATTNRTLKNGELLVVTANMVYTDASGIQGDAIAYMTHRAEATPSALGASIFGAGSFLPTTLLGWVLLIALVLILVLLGNHVYGRFSSEPGH